jgi:hypothetical protein
MNTVKFNVSGTGLWSTVKGSVEITDMRIGYISDEQDFGELCVYFNDRHWDVNIDGLIYTDPQFLAELKQFLAQHGLSTAVGYSEQGMQGDDYVSLDVGPEFIASWQAKFGLLTV